MIIICARLRDIHTLWYRSAKNPDESTGPLARLFARSLAPLTRSLAPPCLLRSRATLCSFGCLLAHSLTPELVGKCISRWLLCLCFFFYLAHNAIFTMTINLMKPYLVHEGCLGRFFIVDGSSSSLAFPTSGLFYVFAVVKSEFLLESTGSGGR